MGWQLFFDILEAFVRSQEFSGVNSDLTVNDSTSACAVTHDNDPRKRADRLATDST